MIHVVRLNAVALGIFGFVGGAALVHAADSVPHDDAPLQMHAQIVSDRLLLTIKNNTERELRVWQLNNSWGYWSFSILLRDVDTGRVTLIVPSDEIDFSRNAPSFFRVKPNEKRHWTFDFRDGTWLIPPQLEKFRHHHFEAKVLYSVAHTAEASKHNVRTGVSESAWIESNGLGWMFANAPAMIKE